MSFANDITELATLITLTSVIFLIGAAIVLGVGVCLLVITAGVVLDSASAIGLSRGIAVIL